MRRSEASDLKLVTGRFIFFATPVRILNLGKKVSFPFSVEGTAMLLRRRPGVYWSVVLSVHGSERCSNLGANAILGRCVVGKGGAVIDVPALA